MNDRLYILDANINRFKEGARVLEDIARFILKDDDLFKKTKLLKKSIVVQEVYRDSASDLGGIQFKENNHRASIMDLIHANAIRMQEAARVLEEFFDSQPYKSLRYKSYDLHQEFILKLKIHLASFSLHGIYPLLGEQQEDLESIAKCLNESVVTICQLRFKEFDKLTVISRTKTLKAFLNARIQLIVNDYLDVALSFADGVHLGQNDFPVKEARKLAGDRFIIGATCRNVAQAVLAYESGASYISVGTLYKSATKLDTVKVALDTVQEICAAVSIPVCVIGGLNHARIAGLSNVGASMYAVQSAIWHSSDPSKELSILT